MAPGLQINGVDLPVLNDGASRSAPILIGERGRSFNGQMIDSVRGRKQPYRFKVGPLTIADAQAFRGLLQGDGQHWSFDDGTFFSSTGLGFSAATGTTGVPATIVGALGRYLTQAGGVSMTWPAQLGSTWSAIVWQYDTSTTTKTHWVIRSDGAKWRNGVSSVLSTPWLSVSSGSLTLAGPVAILDIAAVPYLLPAGWPAQIFARGEVPWSSLPTLVATGDVLPGTLSVEGLVEDADLIVVQSGGAPYVSEWINVTIEEV